MNARISDSCRQLFKNRTQKNNYFNTRFSSHLHTPAPNITFFKKRRLILVYHVYRRWWGLRLICGKVALPSEDCESSVLMHFD